MKEKKRKKEEKEKKFITINNPNCMRCWGDCYDEPCICKKVEVDKRLEKTPWEQKSNSSTLINDYEREDKEKDKM